jgi:hypothetical protein
MVRDRKNPYAPSAADGQDGSYARPPGKFTLTEALGSSGKSAVAPKPAPTAAAGADKPESTDSETEDVVVEAKEAAPASAAPERKLPRLDLGRRGGKP